MDRDTELEVIRHIYAKQIMTALGVSNLRLDPAFALIKREDFLGRGPWQVTCWALGYVPTPDRNPMYLYDDVVVAIVNSWDGKISADQRSRAAAALERGSETGAGRSGVCSLVTAGSLTADARLAVLVMERGYVLYSTDVDFARFSDVRWGNPCKLAGGL